MPALPSLRVQFYDRSHGWCGGTGDRAGDPELRAAVEDALDTTIKFFDRHL